MAIIVDYRCVECGAEAEAFVPSPAPAERECGACGGVSRRRFSPVGIISAGAVADPAAPARRSSAPLCASNPDVPGLCHMSESAGRAWIAQHRGDQRALDREYARQEKAAAESGVKPKMHDAITHAHA